MDTDDLNLATLTWPSFDAADGNTGQPPEADAVDAAEQAKTTTVQEVTPPPVVHSPAFNYSEMDANYRSSAVPAALLPFLIEAKPEGYTPPFYVNRGGTTRASVNPIPGCPPIEPGGKALVFDDWGNPKVIEVTGMFDGEIRGMLGTIPVQYRAWVAMKDEAPLTVMPDEPEAPRLTDEEADALEAELLAWSKFLGARADKHGWCGTFENILRDMGMKPWRPGYEWVMLAIDVPLDAKEQKGVALAKKVGGEVEVASITATAKVKILDVSREDYDNSRWDALLKAAGYKNYRNIRVHDMKKVTA